MVGTRDLDRSDSQIASSACDETLDAREKSVMRRSKNRDLYIIFAITVAFAPIAWFDGYLNRYGWYSLLFWIPLVTLAFWVSHIVCLFLIDVTTKWGRPFYRPSIGQEMNRCLKPEPPEDVFARRRPKTRSEGKGVRKEKPHRSPHSGARMPVGDETPVILGCG